MTQDKDSPFAVTSPERVALSQILIALRQRVKRKYMPDAYGNIVKNRPPRLKEEPAHLAQFPAVSASTETSLFSYAFFEDPIVFANIQIERHQILINLTTHEAVVRRISLTENRGWPWTEWPDHTDFRISASLDEIMCELDQL